MSDHERPSLVVSGDIVTLVFPTDNYALDFRGVTSGKNGGLYAEVTSRHGEQVLHVARFDLLNQREQEGFHQRCKAVNSTVADWQSRLQAAIPGLRELAQHGVSSFSSFVPLPQWPVMAPDAYTGLAGALVQTIAPHSESDPAALLVQFLAYFGVVVGRGPYYQVESTQHHTNLHLCLIGNTSKARKGTSYDNIERLFMSADESWSSHNLVSACGSGEGLVYAVRDPVMKREPIREKGRVTGYQEVEADAGIVDKRLLVAEAEFASVLKVAAREGNLLSDTVRKAWDTGSLRNTVKGSPLKATGAHISVMGHITIEELQRLLTTTEMANGFGNRFLWLCVARSQLLPDGGALHTVDVAPLLEKLREALRSARNRRQMHRDEAARAAWHAVYPALSAGRPGLLGAMLGRAEAQVLRLSMVYALLDGGETILPNHLYAALAVWEYVEASVAHVFARTTGDPLADMLLAAVRSASPHGLTTTQILEDVFQRNRRTTEMARIIQSLCDQNLVRVESYTPPTGRPGTRVVATAYEETRKLQETPQTYLRVAKDAVLQFFSAPKAERGKYEETPTNDASPGVSSYFPRSGINASTPATTPDERFLGVSSFPRTGLDARNGDQEDTPPYDDSGRGTISSHDTPTVAREWCPQCPETPLMVLGDLCKCPLCARVWKTGEVAR